MNKVETKLSVGISRTSNDIVNLSIKDSVSGDHILTVEMTLEEYALAITGLHGEESKGWVNTEANINKKRVIKTVNVESIPKYSNKEYTRELVLKHFEDNYKDDGWIIQSDGTATQQRGEHYQYSIKRYE